MPSILFIRVMEITDILSQNVPLEDVQNPSFVFSSGQRRTAGLAFLIAIFLSRSWCKLKTLVLDDPVVCQNSINAGC